MTSSSGIPNDISGIWRYVMQRRHSIITCSERHGSRAAPGTCTFELAVTGLDGSPPVTTTRTDTVTITVNAATAPVAAIAPIGPDVPQNLPVTLDGTPSTGVATYKWTYLQGTGDPAIDLSSGTNGSKLTFLFPKTERALTFELEVCNGAANPLCNTTTVTIAGAHDPLTVARARYRSGRWQISGTASPLQNVVRIYPGATLPAAGTKALLTANVDALGNWQIDDKSGLPGATSISLETDRGGVQENVPVTR
jgi:hypothetical protein